MQPSIVTAKELAWEVTVRIDPCLMKLLVKEVVLKH